MNGDSDWSVEHPLPLPPKLCACSQQSRSPTKVAGLVEGIHSISFNRREGGGLTQKWGEGVGIRPSHHVMDLPMAYLYANDRVENDSYTTADFSCVEISCLLHVDEVRGLLVQP